MLYILLWGSHIVGIYMVTTKSLKLHSLVRALFAFVVTQFVRAKGKKNEGGKSMGIF